MHYIFVYGSLKRCHYNSYHLSGSQYLGTVTTEKKYDLISLGSYPGVIFGDCRVSGEVYLIDDCTLKNLDILEGEGTWYKREFVELHPNAPREFQGRTWYYRYLRLEELKLDYGGEFVEVTNRGIQVINQDTKIWNPRTVQVRA